MAKVELALDSKCRLGESPVSYPSGSLRFVDIEGCKIYEYNTIADQQVREIGTDGRLVGHIVACASPALPGYDLLASLDTVIVPVNFDGDDKGAHIAAIPDSHLDDATKIRLNDGKVDFQGRLWAGSMAMDASRNPNSATKGRLYCLQRAADESSLELVEKLDQVGISNGTDWFGNHMYYNDSLKAVRHAPQFTSFTEVLCSVQSNRGNCRIKNVLRIILERETSTCGIRKH